MINKINYKKNLQGFVIAGDYLPTGSN